MTVTIVLRAGAVRAQARRLSFGDAVMYATIVDGVVTAVGYGTRPVSDADTYYADLTEETVLPEIDWSFNDVCQTFSATPPTIPPGDIAPPYTPGSPPPVPGTPEYPPNDLDDEDPVPLASTAPTLIVFRGDGLVDLTITGGAGLVEVDERLRTKFPLVDACAIALQATITTVGTGELVVCYSDDNGVTWVELSPAGTGPAIPLNALGTVLGPYVNVAPVAQVFSALLSVFTRDGATAVIGNVSAIVYVKTTNGACLELIEPDNSCAIEVTTANHSDDFLSYTSIANFAATRVNAAVGSDATDYLTLDTTKGLNGAAQSLLATMPAGDTDYTISGALHATFPGALQKVRLVKWVYELEAGMIANTQAGNTIPALGGAGLAEMSCVVANAVTGEAAFALHMRAGRVRLERVNNATVVADVGPISDFTGLKQLVMYGDHPESNQLRIRIYLDVACPDTPNTLTLLVSHTETYSHDLIASDGWDRAFVGDISRVDRGASAQRLWHYQFSNDINPSTYGL